MKVREEWILLSFNYTRPCFTSLLQISSRNVTKFVLFSDCLSWTRAVLSQAGVTILICGLGFTPESSLLLSLISLHTKLCLQNCFTVKNKQQYQIWKILHHWHKAWRLDSMRCNFPRLDKASLTCCQVSTVHILLSRRHHLIDQYQLKLNYLLTC